MRFLILLLALPLYAYVDGTVQKLDVGATTILITNTGPLGGTIPVAFPSPGTGRIKAWFAVGRMPQRVGSENPCANPCGVSLNTEYGKVGYWYEITDASGNPLSPPKLSSMLELPVTTQPCITSNYVAPTALHGFAGYQICYQFTLGAVSVSNLRVWMNAFNLRNGTVGVRLNNNAEHLLATTPVVGLTSDGTTCTFTTLKPHGLAINDVFQLNFANDMVQGLPNPGSSALNGSYTVASAPTTTTLTALCSAAAGDWNTGSGAVGQDNGKTISKTVFYADEKRWFGGMNLAHETFQIMVPLANGEVNANATNTITFIWHDTGDVSINGLAHGAYFDWSIVQPDFEMSQIVVTSTNAVATTTTSQTFANGDTIILRDAPGPKWRFNGKCVLSAATATTFTFPWGCGMTTGTPGVAPYTTTAGTYTLPTSRDTLTAPSPHMYAARSLIPASAYTPYSPTSVSYGGNAANGQTVWQATVLKDPNSWLPNNQSLGVCADCHTKDGSDLKYNGIGQRQNLIAGIRRGLTESDAKDVAAFIAANATPTPTKGRPWNPLYQPMPGMDSQPINQWAAGGGEEWTCVYDQDCREFVVPGGTPPAWTGGSYSAWALNGSFNTHEIPTYTPTPTWFDWLPRINPKDFYSKALGVDFTTQTLWTNYQLYLTNFTNVTLTAGINNSTTSIPVTDASKIANNDFIQIDGEYLQCTTGTGTVGPVTLTCTRAQKSSTAVLHSSGAFVSDYTTFVSGSLGYQYVEQFNDMFNTFVLHYQPEILGGTNQAAGYAWPSQYGPGYYDVQLWTISRKWEIMNRFWLQNMLDQTYLSIVGTPNARAGPQYTRGWYTQAVFPIGPHKAIGGSTLFENRTSRNQTNWNRKTARWYHLAAVIDSGDRMAQGNQELDWPYKYAFDDSQGQVRPSMYMHIMTNAFEVQNTWGWNAMRNNGASAAIMTLHAFRLNLPLGFRYVDLFTPETEKAELLTQIGTQLGAAINGSIFTTANWQDFVLNVNGANSCPLSHVASRSANPFGSICYEDSIALGLAYMNYYSVSATITNPIITWANAVWAASGHDFTTDRSATCSYSGPVPQVLSCP